MRSSGKGQVRVDDTLPPAARRLVKWGLIGFFGVVVLALVLMTFLDFWTAFYISLGLYLALYGPLKVAAFKEHLRLVQDRNRRADG